MLQIPECHIQMKQKYSMEMFALDLQNHVKAILQGQNSNLIFEILIRVSSYCFLRFFLR